MATSTTRRFGLVQSLPFRGEILGLPAIDVDQRVVAVMLDLVKIELSPEGILTRELGFPA